MTITLNRITPTIISPLIFIFALMSCAFNYPATEKRLFSWTISKEQLTEIKTILIANGYERIGKEDVPYEGAYTTLYSKGIDTLKQIENNKVKVLMSFKVSNHDSSQYRNYGFSVFNLEHDDIKEINDEINKIEDIIYSKLISFVGAENVERGPRKLHPHK